MIDQELDTATFHIATDGPDVSILRLSGDLDSHRAGPVRMTFAAVPAASRVVIDLARVTFIDSSGLGALIGGIRRIRESGGEAVMSGPRTSVVRLLQLTGVDALARMVPGVDAGVALLSEADGPR